MAIRKIKTISPKARQRNATLPEFRAKLDLCRIDTARIRALPTKSLKTIQRRVGPIYMLPKKSGQRFRYVFSSFVSNLENYRETPTTDDAAKDAAYRRAYPKDPNPPVPNARIKEMYRQMTNEREREIWDMQAKAGCKLRDTEIVARDAEREGKPEVASKIRAQSRRPPTPHKRPAKIR